MFSTGDQLQWIVSFPGGDTNFSKDKIDQCCCRDQVNSKIQFCNGMRIKKTLNCFIDNKKASDKNHTSFHSGWKKFNFSMPVWMIGIFWFWCQIQTVQSEETRDNVNNALQCICKNCQRIGKKPCDYFYNKKNYCNKNKDSLKSEIFFWRDQSVVDLKVANYRNQIYHLKNKRITFTSAFYLSAYFYLHTNGKHYICLHAQNP